MKTHYINPARSYRTACGRYTEDGVLTSDNPHEATCEKCRRTSLWLLAADNAKPSQTDLASLFDAVVDLHPASQSGVGVRIILDVTLSNVFHYHARAFVDGHVYEAPADNRYAPSPEEAVKKLVEYIRSPKGYSAAQPEPRPDEDVHTEHCCKQCGCKYGDDERCTVVNGSKKQSFECGQLEVCGA